MSLADTTVGPDITERLRHDIAATRAPLREARHAPAAIYTSPEIYALEKSKIFMRDWLCIARGEEIAKPGDYMTFMVMDEPIVITRDIGGSINPIRAFARTSPTLRTSVPPMSLLWAPKTCSTRTRTDERVLLPCFSRSLSGLLRRPLRWIRLRNPFSFNAFRNACLHRGLVVAKGSGNARGFSCEYHGWRYDLTGRLVGAPFMDRVEGFDLSQCRLPPLGCDVWEGWIFVSFADDAPPLAEYLGEFAGDFAMLGMGRCRAGYKQSWEVACNWKIMNENNHDLYHVQAVHADTFGDAITHAGLSFNLRDNGRISSFYSDAPLQPDRRSLFGRMPWMEDQPDEFACVGHLPPNLVLVGRSDSSVAVISWPVSVSQTLLLCYQIFPAAVFDDPDIDAKLKNYDDFVRIILAEDTGTVAETHKAVTRESYRPGPFSHLEANLHHCLNDYFDRLFDGAA